MFGCVSCAGPAVHSLGSSRIQRAAVKQSENRQGAGAAPSAAQGHAGNPPSLPQQPLGKAFGKAGRGAEGFGEGAVGWGCCQGLQWDGLVSTGMWAGYHGSQDGAAGMK